MRTNGLIAATGLVLLVVTGCVSTVQKPDGGGPVPVGTKAAGKLIALNVAGSETTMSAKDWAAFRGIWNDECRDEFHEGGAEFSMQDGSAQPTGSAGTTPSLPLGRVCSPL